MAGIIESAAGAEQGMAPEGAPAPEQGGQEITVDSVREGMKLPDDLRAAYEKTVKAGLRLMFDPSTREDTAAFMEGPGAPAEKLSKGVAGVMLMLFKESNQTMPPQVIIPAGIELLVHAAEVSNDAGLAVSNNDIAEGIADMIGLILKQFGVNPDQMQGMLTQMTGGTKGAPLGV